MFIFNLVVCNAEIKYSRLRLALGRIGFLLTAIRLTTTPFLFTSTFLGWAINL